MAHTRHRKRGSVRALRREVPCTVAVLAAESDFGAISGYRTFPFGNYAGYLRHTEALLHSLSEAGLHLRVALFDPVRFAVYCDERRRDPDDPASRAQYTAEVAGAGPTVPYGGQRLAALLPLLREHRHRTPTWEEAQRLLAAADSAPGGAAGGGERALDLAVEALARILEVLGQGRHHLVCSVGTPGTPLLAALHAERDAQGTLRLHEPGALLLCHVLGAGIATGSAGGLVVRSGPCPGTGEGPEVVRGWRLQDGWLCPLTEAEVFSAYCTDADTGEPIPPEPGVHYRAGVVLPRAPHGKDGGAPGTGD